MRYQRLQLFSRPAMAAMRDRTKARKYSPAKEEFRRDHARRRRWGLVRRHALKLCRLHGCSRGCGEAGLHDVVDAVPPLIWPEGSTLVRPSGATSAGSVQDAESTSRRRPASPTEPAPSVNTTATTGPAGAAGPAARCGSVGVTGRVARREPAGIFAHSGSVGRATRPKAEPPAGPVAGWELEFRVGPVTSSEPELPADSAARHDPARQADVVTSVGPVRLAAVAAAAQAARPVDAVVAGPAPQTAGRAAPLQWAGSVTPAGPRRGSVRRCRAFSRAGRAPPGRVGSGGRRGWRLARCGRWTGLGLQVWVGRRAVSLVCGCHSVLTGAPADQMSARRAMGAGAHFRCARSIREDCRASIYGPPRI